MRAALQVKVDSGRAGSASAGTASAGITRDDLATGSNPEATGSRDGRFANRRSAPLNTVETLERQPPRDDSASTDEPASSDQAAPDTQAAPDAAAAGASQVWVNTNSGVYHFPGTRYFGRTKEGTYMSQQEADAHGYRAAQNGQ